MRKILIITAFISMVGLFKAQETWKKDQLIIPKELAEKINSKTAVPLVLNVGPMSLIKGAIKIGPCNTDEGIRKLKDVMASNKTAKSVVVYCGCCSSANCPNIKPAYKELVLMGIKDVKVLDIPVGFAEDWAAKGYPVE